MSEYRIEFAPAAKRQFDRLHRDLKERIRPHIDALATNPRPHGVKKLTGPEGLYRIRVGGYRVVYQVRDEELLVLVVRVADRKDVYR